MAIGVTYREKGGKKGEKGKKKKEKGKEKGGGEGDKRCLIFRIIFSCKLLQR